MELLKSKGKHRAVKDLEKKIKIDLRHIVEEKGKSMKDILETLNSLKFSEADYGILALLSIHKMHVTTIETAKKFLQSSRSSSTISH